MIYGTSLLKLSIVMSAHAIMILQLLCTSARCLLAANG